MVFILEDAILSSFLGYSSIDRLLPFVVPQSRVLNLSLKCCILHLTCRRQSSQWTNFLHQRNTVPVVGVSDWHGGSSMLKERAPRNILFSPGFSQSRQPHENRDAGADYSLRKRSMRADRQARNSVEVWGEFTHSAYIPARDTVDCAASPYFHLHSRGLTLVLGIYPSDSIYV